jgi:WD40 repeat protein
VVTAATKLPQVTRATIAIAVAFTLSVVGAFGKKAEPVAEGKPPARTDRYGDPLPEGAIARLGTARFHQSFPAARAVYSPDGKTVLVSGPYSRFDLYDAATGKKVRDYAVFGGDGSPAEFSADGKLFAVGGRKPSVRSVATGEILHELGNRARSVTLGNLRDGTVVAAVSDGLQIVLWNARTGERLRSFGWGFDLSAFSPDGNVMVTALQGRSLWLWDPTTGRVLHHFDGPEPLARVGSVRFSPDGKLLAVVTQDQTVQLYDVANLKELTVLRHKDRPGACSVAFAPSGRELAVGNFDGTIAIFAVPGGKEVRRWRAHTWYAGSVNYSPDGRALVSTGPWECGPSFWDVATGKPLHTFGGHRGPVDQLAFSADGKALFSGSWIDQLALRWDVCSGNETHCFPFSRDKFERVAVSPDGRMLATEAGPFSDGTVMLWDVATGKTHPLPEKHDDGALLQHWPPWPRTIVFSADGKLLAYHGPEQTIVVWDAAVNRLRCKLRGQPRADTPLRFSADGTVLVAIGWDKGSPVVRLWDLKSPGEPRTIEYRGDTEQLALDPNGKLLAVSQQLAHASGDPKELVKLIEISTGKEVFRTEGSLRAVFDIAFSPDGRYVCAVGSDAGKQVHLWEVATGLELRRFAGHHPVSVTFSPDCRSFATGGVDSTIVIWDLTGRATDGRKRPASLSAAELEECWNDLVGFQGEPVLRAVWDLVDHPRQAVPLLRERIRTDRPPSAEELARLISRLNDDEFAVRERAEAELGMLGDLAEGALRKALKDEPSAETRRRVERLLEPLTGIAKVPDRRSIRAVAVLEYIGNPEARQALEALAKGAPQARLTREARSALVRLARRPTAVP